MANTRQALDTIRVKNISLLASFTDGAQWPSDPPKAKLQPIELTVAIAHSIAAAALTDDLDHSINYSTVCKTAIAAGQSRAFASSEDCVNHVIAACFDSHKEVQTLTVTLRRPKALLQPAFTELTCSRRRGSSSSTEELAIRNLEAQPIVGINDCEREQAQLVRFDVQVQRTSQNFHSETPFPFRDVALNVINAVNATSFLTLEALVAAVADKVASLTHGLDSVTVCGGKPDALSCAEAAEVKITRTAKEMYTQASIATKPADGAHVVALALGSNLGDRFANIELALRLLEAPNADLVHGSEAAYVHVVDTSFMYETEPMYETDQPKFINCACLVHTNIEPVTLLKFLKHIENTVGRVVSYRNGPRAIDLDVLTYDDLIIDTRAADDRKNLDNLEGQLVVPHPRMFEREFVLRPLNDIIPDYLHPGLRRTINGLFASLMASLPEDNPVMYRVIPFPQYPLPSGNESVDLPVVPPTATHWVFPAVSGSMPQGTPRKSYLMATLNATPDSFSDGSVNNTIPAALTYASSAVANGADIVDVGGYSTRPGAEFVSCEEEINRVVPVIHAIRNAAQSADVSEKAASQTRQTLISVDTFRWEVAEAAVKAGANCINDVYAFIGRTWPVDAEGEAHFQKFREVARKLAVPVILMHSRGEASANKDYSEYSYAADTRGRGAVLEAVRVELGKKVDAAVRGKGGLRRWLVIVDPGIGFSKTVEGNLELLRNSSATVDPTQTVGREKTPNPLAGYPVLIGASRKSFLGTILAQKDAAGTYEGRETKPVERMHATGAAVACAVQQGATVIRVHDVLEMGDVVRVSSLLWG
ncbi:Dihydropteroate synthase [Phanerochaete sordida]|uniref:Dihydropteroate synthase n=1 Tax=Phanerochaete sordida TaxID=48140 RepID=A0A9P3GEM0_9APHY|nr:Dihydropteroate synthase [Phanerochaete sordida]